MTRTASSSLELGQDDLEGLVQRAGLLVRVADGLEDDGAHRLGLLGRAVGAVVGAHHDEVRRRVLRVQRLDRRLDLALLVVGGDQRDDEPAGRSGRGWVSAELRGPGDVGLGPP